MHSLEEIPGTGINTSDEIFNEVMSLNTVVVQVRNETSTAVQLQSPAGLGELSENEELNENDFVIEGSLRKTASNLQHRALITSIDSLLTSHTEINGFVVDRDIKQNCFEIVKCPNDLATSNVETSLLLAVRIPPDRVEGKRERVIKRPTSSPNSEHVRLCTLCWKLFRQVEDET